MCLFISIRTLTPQLVSPITNTQALRASMLRDWSATFATMSLARRSSHQRAG